MTVQGALPFVQTTFPDQVGLGFPGQIFSGSDASYNNVTQSFANEGIVFCGRAVSRATDQDFTNNDVAMIQPFTVEIVQTGTLVAELVGIVTRPFTLTQNFQDTVATQAVPDGKNKAGFGDKVIVPVLRFGSKQRIIVTQATSLGAVSFGDPVFVMIDPANSFNLAVGEFSNAITANAAHSLLVPNAIWWLPKGPTDDALDPVGVIELL